MPDAASPPLKLKPKRAPKESPLMAIGREFTMGATLKGCPIDQIFNFLKAEVLLQPKQLEFAAACRECDSSNGPTMVMAHGGRGSAKSHGILAQIFCDDCQR